MRTRPEMTMDAVEATLLELPTFAERLNWLMGHVERPDATADVATSQRRSVFYSNTEVAKVIGTSEQYVSKMRSGSSPNPSIDVVRRLAYFFEIDPGLLIPPWAEVTLPDQERTRHALRVAARLTRLGPDSMGALGRILDGFNALDRKTTSADPDRS